eukprot:827288-Rhodomonas_salina.2
MGSMSGPFRLWAVHEHVLDGFFFFLAQLAFGARGPFPVPFHYGGRAVCGPSALEQIQLFCLCHIVTLKDASECGLSFPFPDAHHIALCGCSSQAVDGVLS